MEGVKRSRVDMRHGKISSISSFRPSVSDGIGTREIRIRPSFMSVIQ